MEISLAGQMKQLLGVVLKDLPRYLPALLTNNRRSYLSLCNRNETLNSAPDGSGYRCAWQWTSVLYAPTILPFLGSRLMRCALAEHPVRHLPQPDYATAQPEISFIIGHRGEARLPHLLATLESIAGQQGVSCECLVVEQESSSLLAGHLPSWVRHIHTPPPSADLPYCRSWAFNVGYGEAKGKILVLHDNDMLVPADYAAQILARTDQGYEVVNLKRFIFYLTEIHTQQVFFDHAALTARAPEAIVQNLEAGGSVGITRDAFERIGGMDETFVGWGGEDNEFWERAQTCKVWPYGYLPLLHLWHPAQPEKHQIDNPALQRYRVLSAIPLSKRVEQLRSRIQGQLCGPCSGSATLNKGRIQ